jgi:phage host-nuclease inhibitor protein Gam
MSTELLREIETATHHYAAKRDELRAIAGRCKAEIDAIRERYRAEIRAAASDAAAARDDLALLIDRHRDLFKSPRTRLFSGIKVGLRKTPGRVEFADTKRVLELIRRKLPELADRLIRVKEEPNREAIKELEPRQLAAIGASLVATGDEIVIAHARDEIDALIDALTAEDA